MTFNASLKPLSYKSIKFKLALLHIFIHCSLLPNKSKVKMITHYLLVQYQSGICANLDLSWSVWSDQDERIRDRIWEALGNPLSII